GVAGGRRWWFRSGTRRGFRVPVAQPAAAQAPERRGAGSAQARPSRPWRPKPKSALHRPPAPAPGPAPPWLRWENGRGGAPRAIVAGRPTALPEQGSGGG